MSDETRDAFRAVVRDVLGDHAAGEVLDWGTAASLGWCGLEVPEMLGGAGAGFGEVAVVAEEIGRVAGHTPYLGAVALGAAALGMVESDDQIAERRRAMATGATRAVLVLDAGSALDATGAAFRIDAACSLTGTADFVVDATRADRLLVPALDDDGAWMLVDLDADTPGLTVQARPVLDATRDLASVDAEKVAVDGASIRPFAQDPSDPMGRLQARAASCVALDALGAAETMLAATVAYVGVREQFGRPVGSFQAVKHACADMAVQLRIGRELCDAAVASLADGVATTSETVVAASRAKAYLGDAGVRIVGDALQLHGGIGYTWESGVHVFFERVGLDRVLFGSPAEHRRRIAAPWLKTRG